LGSGRKSEKFIGKGKSAVLPKLIVIRHTADVVKAASQDFVVKKFIGSSPFFSLAQFRFATLRKLHHSAVIEN